ncbi:ribonuclease PH [Calditerrivibrio nitroreducens]|uniref:Ribonuclease PH n=1 Tax=Calditerrivibrio nitroreducens (strain DSM 19672 / NBRC 101217 / Yu37-1) TaxID=768670 RepID=E4TFM7_CALNY|nr:ribonuclease PH [Calditerrivibrio nitroreducens]ADR18495.1 RNAse PH [Calditerrivibrio nitroreducens DSM 19672]
MRNDGRLNDQLRDIRVVKDYIRYPQGSVLIEYGETKVICNATISEGVPPFLKGTGTGWLTSEYSMLPCSTHTRNQRESQKGKLTGRTQEISRLIGRSLRSAIDLSLIGERTITIDCDVIQADGGTRTASITGGFLALYIACQKLSEDLKIGNPIKSFVAAVSLGIVNGEIMLDLNYEEDSNAEADINLIANEKSEIIEIQGTSEKGTFDKDMLNKMIDLGLNGINQLIDIQKRVLNLK